MTLKDELVRARRLRWLDVGCGGNFQKGFQYIDVFAEDLLDEQRRSRYTRLDMVHVRADQLAKLGFFDLVRMQHAFEHFTYEDGLAVLKNCALIMQPGAILLITAPDLKIHAQKYLSGGYPYFMGFKDWAETRIPPGAPDSFYFSIFAHSMQFESHQWCYDFEGLKYQLEAAGSFAQIEELKTSDPRAEVPFTHNRPNEDVCVIAVRK